MTIPVSLLPLYSLIYYLGIICSICYILTNYIFLYSSLLYNPYCY
nr:MAG TPA: hypothetical protein [Bacteriophage sp.]